MRVVLTAGQAGDNPQLVALLDGIAVARTGPGRPRRRPEVMIADQGLRATFDPGGDAATANPFRVS
jgi:hypothetical protein